MEVSVFSDKNGRVVSDCEYCKPIVSAQLSGIAGNRQHITDIMIMLW